MQPSALLGVEPAFLPSLRGLRVSLSSLASEIRRLQKVVSADISEKTIEELVVKPFQPGSDRSPFCAIVQVEGCVNVSNPAKQSGRIGKGATTLKLMVRQGQDIRLLVLGKVPENCSQDSRHWGGRKAFLQGIWVQGVPLANICILFDS